MDQSTPNNASGMEYGNRDVNTVGGQLPMPLSKFQSNVSSSKISGSNTTNSQHIISVKNSKRVFEGNEEHQFLKSSLTNTSSVSSSSVKKFFGRNKGKIILTVHPALTHITS